MADIFNNPTFSNALVQGVQMVSGAVQFAIETQQRRQKLTQEAAEQEKLFTLKTKQLELETANLALQKAKFDADQEKDQPFDPSKPGSILDIGRFRNQIQSLEDLVTQEATNVDRLENGAEVPIELRGLTLRQLDSRLILPQVLRDNFNLQKEVYKSNPQMLAQLSTSLVSELEREKLLAPAIQGLKARALKARGENPQIQSLLGAYRDALAGQKPKKTEGGEPAQAAPKGEIASDLGKALAPNPVTTEESVGANTGVLTSAFEQRASRIAGLAKGDPASEKELKALADDYRKATVGKSRDEKRAMLQPLAKVLAGSNEETYRRFVALLKE